MIALAGAIAAGIIAIGAAVGAIIVSSRRAEKRRRDKMTKEQMEKELAQKNQMSAAMLGSGMNLLTSQYSLSAPNLSRMTMNNMNFEASPTFLQQTKRPGATTMATFSEMNSKDAATTMQTLKSIATIQQGTWATLRAQQAQQASFATMRSQHPVIPLSQQNATFSTFRAQQAYNTPQTSLTSFFNQPQQR